MNRLNQSLGLRLPGIAGEREWTEDDIFKAVCKAVSFCHRQLRAVIANGKISDEEAVELNDVLQIADQNAGKGQMDGHAIFAREFGLSCGAIYNRRTVLDHMLYTVFNHRKLIEKATITEKDPERPFIMAQALAITEQWAAMAGVETEFEASEPGESYYEKLVLKYQARQIRKINQWQADEDKIGKVINAKLRRKKGGAR